ncbi:MAG: hypothetical protein IT548_13740 [Alphaproteobacteria bacterium]|nr:hypothetical protein [Alphaproteobacteria bacterium]
MFRLALASLLLTGVALAGDDYAYGLAAKQPAAFAAWQKLVPAAERQTKWIYALDATATPLVPETVGGGPGLGGWACKPHDCGDNQLSFLLAEDGSRAVARVILKAAAPVFWGDPTPEEQQLLVKLAEE